MLNHDDYYRYARGREDGKEMILNIEMMNPLGVREKIRARLDHLITCYDNWPFDRFYILGLFTSLKNYEIAHNWTDDGAPAQLETHGRTGSAAPPASPA